METNKREPLSEKKKNVIIVSISLLSILIIVALSFLFSLLSKYKATSEARRYLNSDENVLVEKVDNYFTFTPKNGEVKRGLIFYQGAKVENVAYAPLLYRFAMDTNTFCVLTKTPFNIPIFSVDEAKKPIEKFTQINHWYLAGHSLGGIAASEYASRHLEQIEGIIFLASYSTVDLTNTSLKVASIYGDQDLVLNQSAYQKSKVLLPSFKEKIILGANHAGFGMYDNQSRDGLAKIDKLTQIKETVNFCQETIFTMSE